MAIDWHGVQNLLCVRLDALGDVLMTTPAIRALRASAAGRRITLLASPGGAEVARLVPGIDDVLVFEAPWMKATPPLPDPRLELDLVELLRTLRFDAAVIFTVFTQSALPAAHLCHLAGIQRRLAHCRENPYHLLTGWVPETDTAASARHEVRRQLDLVATVGAHTSDERLSLSVPDAARTRVHDLLSSLRLDRARPWAVVHPGASAPSRRYTPEGFAAAARALAMEGWQMLFTGGNGERALVEAIRRQMELPSVSLAGKLSLAELAAVLEAAPVLISNNTGPVHVAAALGTPVVDLYALTNPQHTPWQVPSRVLFHDVPCRNCFKSVCPEGHHNCLRLVPPDAIVAAARELVDQRPVRRSPLTVLT
ncbi:MAG: glycosyltransferase family 9 protein [Chloroflexota bacterium]|nr:glycosyltransferase family 9 protein [Chloroflexota bacterium]